MPAKFDRFGVQFLYPDNWKVVETADDQADDGVTLELPSGGFVSIEVNPTDSSDDEVVKQVQEAFAEEYEEVELDLISDNENESTNDFRFYYLDLVIVSRLVLMRVGGKRLLVQMQAESRDFESNEKVFDAILTQIRG